MVSKDATWGPAALAVNPRKSLSGDPSPTSSKALAAVSRVAVHPEDVIDSRAFTNEGKLWQS